MEINFKTLILAIPLLSFSTRADFMYFKPNGCFPVDDNINIGTRIKML